MKQGRRPTQTNLFDATLNETLKHYTEPDWLGNNIPLATPYFLGRHLHGIRNADTPLGLGKALQAVVAEAADSLWPGPLPQSQGGLLSAVQEERMEFGNDGPRYRYLLLDLRYLRRYFPSNTAPNQVSVMPDYLGVSKTRFFEHLKEAREALGLALLKLVQPGLRLEQPVPTGPIIGRKELLQQCISDLRNGRSVTITGFSGIGKTTFASAVAQEWSRDNGDVYWFTFRPGLNDDLDSLIFTLAHFLSQRGCANLWLQLNANQGQIGSIEQALGFLREDFECASDQNILFCFDEIDLLHTSTTQRSKVTYGQLFEFIKSIEPIVPLLLIGQLTLIDTNTYYNLSPLSPRQTAKFLQNTHLSSSQIAEQLHKITEGNPRLIELLLAVYRNESEIALDKFSKSIAIETVFQSLWNRLAPGEKDLMATLSAFRAFAPADEWLDEPAYHHLQERNLLKFDTQGGVALLPLYRNLVYETLPDQFRQYCHQQAASIRDRHGRYTEAAYHLWLAGGHDLAVNLWHEHQDFEIAQGKTAAAYAIFCQNETIELTGRTAKKLTLVQNRLNLLFGEAQQVLDRMEEAKWEETEKETADLFQQMGEAHFISGDTEAALGRYNDAIMVLGELSSQLILLYRYRGQMLIGQAASNAVKRDIQQAEFELEMFKGLFELSSGRFASAKANFNSALEIAQKLGDERQQARANQYLAMAHGNLGDIPTANQRSTEAMNYYQKIGNRLQLESTRAELAGYYLNVGRFEEVIEPAEEALKFFENIQHPARIGYLCSNLAEAYYETGNLETAETYANRALNSGNPRVQPYVYYTLGLIYQAKAQLPEAERHFQHGIDFAEQAEERFIAAYLYRAYGRMLLEKGSSGKGTEKLIKALTLFANLSMQREVEKTQELLGL